MVPWPRSLRVGGRMIIRALKHSFTAVAGALLLASCAGPPIVPWKRENPAQAAASMENAMWHLESARSTYRGAVIAQMERETGVSNVVLGAGALVALLAAGKGGSDAILGTAAIGGTVYAVGNLTLRRQRVLAYQAGVDALDCAQQAATPFNVPKIEIDELLGRINTLEQSQGNLIARIGKAESIRASLPAASTEVAMLGDTLATAATTRQAANNALNASQQFVGSVGSAAGQLVATVDRIDSAVTRSLIESTPDLSSIKAQISGMPEMIGILAPSLQSRATAGLDKANQVVAAKSAGARSPAENANQELATAILDTAAATDSVNNRLKLRVAVGTPEAALKACGVVKVVTDLVVDKASLTFPAGVAGVGFIEIRGGVPPYESEFEGALVEGVTDKLVRANRLQVSVSSKVTGTHHLSVRISDQSQPPKVASVPVTITAAGSAVSKPKTPASGGTSRPAAVAPAQQAAAAIHKQNPFTHARKKFGLTGAPQVSGNVIAVNLLCPVGDATKYTQVQLANSLLAQAGIATTPKPVWSLRFTGACVSS